MLKEHLTVLITQACPSLSWWASTIGQIDAQSLKVTAEFEVEVPYKQPEGCLFCCEGQRVDRKFELSAKLREVYEAWRAFLRVVPRSLKAAILVMEQYGTIQHTVQ